MTPDEVPLLTSVEEKRVNKEMRINRKDWVEPIVTPFQSYLKFI